jgi:hypothetical protein
LIGSGSGAQDAGRVVATTRRIAASLAATPVALLAASLLVPPPPPSRALVAPAALAGLVAFAVGNRWYRGLLDRVGPDARPAARAAALRKATIAGLACTEAASLVGVVAFHVSREPFALVGVAAHLILVGASWPTRARLERILEATDDSGPGPGPN